VAHEQKRQPIAIESEVQPSTVKNPNELGESPPNTSWADKSAENPKIGAVQERVSIEKQATDLETQLKSLADACSEVKRQQV